MVNLVAFLMDTLVYIGLFSIATLSLNLEYGFTGIVNFGKAAFVMIGAYVTAILSLIGIPFLVSLLAGMAAAGSAGFLTSLPTLRLRGDYFAIVTLVFAESLRTVLKNETWIAGGPVGLQGVPSFLPSEGLSYELYLSLNLMLVYSVFAVFYIFSHFLLNSPYGRIMRSIREDELSSESLGKNTFRCKVQVVTISSAMSGAAGGILAQYIGYVGPDFFLPLVMTFSVWIMSVLGGHANITGALLGASVVKCIERGARILKDFVNVPIDPNNLMYMLTGALMIAMLLLRPEGILKERPIKTLRRTTLELARRQST